MNSILKFDTDIQMLYRLGLDREHWINKEQLQYFKKHVYESTPQNVIYYPAELDKIKLLCSNGHEFTPAWLEKRPPIMPYYAGDGKIIRPHTTKTPCRKCDTFVDVPLTGTEYKSDAQLFSDEAIREIGNKVLFTYSLVSKPRNHDIHENFKADFYSLKKSLVPALPPSSWVLHYKELFNPKARVRQKHLASISDEEVLSFSKDLGTLLCNYQDEIVKWNCTGVYERPHTFKKAEVRQLKSLVYYPLLIRAISETTASGFSPHIFIEKSGDDGWAKNLFKGGRLTLMWPYISNLIPVPSPKFVPPVDSLYLEIADYISYTVASYLYQVAKKSEGAEIEITCSPKWFGQTRYLGFTEKSACIYATEPEYPLAKFFKGTTWEAIS